MKQYEKDLKYIQSKNTRDTILSHDQSDVPLGRLRVLKALGLVDIEALYDNLFRIVITDDGIAYFIRKSENRKLWVFNTATQIIVLVVATVIAAVIGILIGINV